MRNNKFKIIAFIALLIVPTIVWLSIKVISPATYERLDYDLGEKREKTQIESITQLAASGDVLADYFADRAPFRSSLVTFYQKTNSKLEAPYDDKWKPAILAALYGTSISEIDDVGDSAFNELFSGAGNSTSGSSGNGSSGGNTAGNSSDGSGDGTGNSSAEDVHEHEWIYAGGQDVSLEQWGYSIYFCNICHVVEYRDWKKKLVDDSYLAPVVYNDMTIIGRSDWLFLYGLGNINYYMATNIMSESEMNAYMQTLITLDEMCQERGIKLAICLAPNKDQVYSEYMPSYTVENDYKRTERLVDYIKNNSDVAISYPIKEIIYCDRYWQTYYRYDTHWNTMGAFIGVQAIYSSLGMTVTDPLSLNCLQYEYGSAGDLIDLGGLDSSKFAPDIDYMLYYKDDVVITFETDGYESVENIYRTTSECGNPEKLVLIGDSFRAKMIDPMKRDFAECAFFNREVISSADADILSCNVLVLQANERNDARIITSAQYIIDLFSRQ